MLCRLKMRFFFLYTKGNGRREKGTDMGLNKYRERTFLQYVRTVVLFQKKKVITIMFATIIT